LGRETANISTSGVGAHEREEKNMENGDKTGYPQTAPSAGDAGDRDSEPRWPTERRERLLLIEALAQRWWAAYSPEAVSNR
jgi:hypothetical protein